MNEDDIRDIAIRITDKLVEENIIEDCLKTGGDIEFSIQDIINEELTKELQCLNTK